VTALVLVDSNVVLDIVTNDLRWIGWSSAALARCASGGPLVINPIIYAEISVGFKRVEDVDDVLSPGSFRRYDLPFEAAFLAGKVFRAYRRRGGSKTSPLPDFYIGAHAAVARLRLLTRDPARYRTYFPTVELIAP
jgi:predicted nucleic acid-binding protein